MSVSSIVVWRTKRMRRWHIERTDSPAGHIWTLCGRSLVRSDPTLICNGQSALGVTTCTVCLGVLGRGE